MSDPQPTTGEPTQEEVQAMVDEALNGVPLPMSPEQEYDTIMREINPELQSGNIGALTTQIAAEAPEQKAARAARYTKDFQQFETRVAARGARLSAEMSKHYHATFAALEVDTRKAEAQDIAALEASFGNAT